MTYFDERFKLTHRINGLAQGIDAEIAKDLEKALEKVSGRLATLEAKADKVASYVRKREFLIKQRATITQVLDDVYKEVGTKIQDQSVNLAMEAPAIHTEMLAEYGIKATAMRFTRKRVTAYFQSFELDGQMFNEWLEKIKKNTADRIIRETKQSMILGETRKEATTRLQGALNVSRQSASSLAENSMNQMYNWAELENNKANKFTHVRWMTELDKQTCNQCAPLDQQEYKIEDLPRVPPLHWKCRCFTEPITKGEILNASFSKRPARIEVEGSKELEVQQVKKNVSYNQWMQKMATSKKPKHQAFAREALGAKRFELVQSGKLTVNRLYYNNKLLTIKQLRGLK